MPERVAVKGCCFKSRSGVTFDRGDGGRFIIEFPKTSKPDAAKAEAWDKTFTLVFMEDVPNEVDPPGSQVDVEELAG